MPWYVLQTKTGEEEKLVEMIRRIIPGHLYGECFVVYHEQLWRRQQETFVQVKRAFPGYVFITSREPEALFFCLKQVSAMVRMMADDESFFLSLEPEEADFLWQIMDENHVIGLSYLETDGRGNIQQVSGPLASCVEHLARCRYGRRYAIVRLQLLGREKEVFLGIVLKEDICQELRYGKVEAPIQVPKRYRAAKADEGGKGRTAPAAERKRAAAARMVREKGTKSTRVTVGKAAEAARMAGEESPKKESKPKASPGFSTGDSVIVVDGGFQGMAAMVYEVKSKAVTIGVRLFGRDMEVELPPELLRKREQG